MGKLDSSKPIENLGSDDENDSKPAHIDYLLDSGSNDIQIHTENEKADWIDQVEETDVGRDHVSNGEGVH